MVEVDDDCIVKLYCSFQDRCYIYFLLEILTGGEIFAYLRKQQRFSESTCKFYTNAVTQALQHMHEKRVAYRDFKPENICLDSQRLSSTRRLLSSKSGRHADVDLMWKPGLPSPRRSF